MRGHQPLLAIFVALALHPGAWAQDELGDLLSEPGVRLSRNEDRARIVAKMRDIENQRLTNARTRAAAKGLLIRRQTPNGGVEEIVDFVGDRPIYLTTHNASAAISTGANVIRSSRSLDGAGITIGMWDGGWGLTSHVEFNHNTSPSRMVVRDTGSTPVDHATHVGGTLIAAGADASSRGMAPAAIVHSYDWVGDISEMTNRAATASGQADRLYISNHSYGIVSGWRYVNGGSPFHVWEWSGDGATAADNETSFGQYNTYARGQDSLANSAPYYLIFRSAGNDRDNNPTAGSSVKIGSSVVSYNSSSHPPGDGIFRGGYETISNAAVAKNVMTIGAVNDAVSGTNRSVANATMSGFSSWGPTDDGRIKPDLVANGVSVKSSVASGSYDTFSGTSMASPNAAGTAALLIQQYRNLFSGQSMRSSTLKGLLIHTADDRGNPGPDYQFGWGLMNAIAASDLIQSHHDSPLAPRIIESSVSTSVTSRIHSFAWDGSSPIRATLCWTDPAGATDTGTDSRTPALIHNLNLKIIAPGGSERFPFVMPFVGNWSQASMNSHATTGINNTDNVEQVHLATPPAPGIYQAVVSYSGTLTATQNYSLLISGNSALPPSISSITPDAAGPGTTAITLTGNSFESGAVVRFSRLGQADRFAVTNTVSLENIQCTLDTTGMEQGAWNVTVSNPNGKSATLANGFTALRTLWSQNLDTGAPGWSTAANIGTNQWSLVTNQSHSPSTSWFASGPSTRSTANLVSEGIPIPANATNLQLSFWHKYNLQSGYDGGVLEFSLDNGSNWFRVGNSGNSAEIIIGKYGSNLIDPGGNPNNKNEFFGNPAWSGNSGSAFTEVVVALKNTAEYAGNTLRVRWRLATNSSTASQGGWFVDSVKINAIAPFANQPPQIITAASASPSLVTGLSTQLSVSASDDGGEEGLTYEWIASGGDGGSPVSFSDNSSNSAKVTTATFFAAGNYQFEVTVRDAEGLTAVGTVGIVVEQTPDFIFLDPTVAQITYGQSLEFTRLVFDQFGSLIMPQPEPAWTSTGGGTFVTPGVFTAQQAGGPFTVTASLGTIMETAEITVTKAAASIELAGLLQTQDGSPKPVTANTTPPGLEVLITYDNSLTAPTDAGTYTVSAVIADGNHVGSAMGMLVIEAMDDAYSSWAENEFNSTDQAAGLAVENADPDSDGLSNLAEYALGSDPNGFTPPPAAVVDANGLSFTFTRPADRSDILYKAESSDGLGTWSDALLELVADGATQTWRARDPLSTGDPAKRFLRLKFVRQ